MKKYVSAFLSFFIPVIMLAEEPDTTKLWSTGGDASLTLSQVSFNNWAAGGQDAQTGTFLFIAYANYKKDRHAWDNSLQVGYGLTRQGSENLIKSDDRVLVTSKYGYNAAGHWFYSGLVDFRTQMTTGYQDPPQNTVTISNLMAPAYLLLSVGMDYKPSDAFSVYLSPLTSKMTFVLDDELADRGLYGVDPGDNFRGEFGASTKIVYRKRNIIKNVDLFTRLDLFSNLADNPQYIDVDWEGRINMRVNDFLTAVISLNLLYDNDIKYVDSEGNKRGARVQTKQLLGFGLSYSF
ncbi:DUF3078 domain-containing protein [Natronoflexus pectinivorans]|nr:DUF3078 domain-containing protein [Natronoflexus pectinivorans]